MNAARMKDLFIVVGLCCFFGNVDLFSVERKGEMPLSPNLQIVGGQSTSITDFPYTAALFLAGSLCGGSLYNSSFIITAAHCIENKLPKIANFSILLNSTSLRGSRGYILAAVQRAIVHPNYSRTTKDNDVAILKLKTSVSLPSVLLPPLGSDETYAGKNADIIGWGTTSQGGKISETLLQATVTVWNNTACANPYGSGINGLKLCAAAPGKDTCQGDSGGPLLVDNVLVGITSYGIGCAKASHPGVYARITSLNSWIRETILSM